MSITAEWKKLVADQVLHRLDPMDGDRPMRTILMTEEVRDLVLGDWEDGPEGNRRARLLATLQNIVAGRKLKVCLEPYEAREAVIGRLNPTEDSIWDIRCREKPAIRVFCFFVERDVLLAVTCRPRSVKIDWLGWLPLGDRNSKEWRDGIAATKRKWTMYFPAESPVRGDNLNDYLSNATLE